MILTRLVIHVQSSGSRFNAHAHVNLGPGLAYTGRSRGTWIPRLMNISEYEIIFRVFL